MDFIPWEPATVNMLGRVNTDNLDLKYIYENLQLSNRLVYVIYPTNSKEDNKIRCYESYDPNFKIKSKKGRPSKLPLKQKHTNVIKACICIHIVSCNKKFEKNWPNPHTYNVNLSTCGRLNIPGLDSIKEESELLNSINVLIKDLERLTSKKIEYELDTNKFYLIKAKSRLNVEYNFDRESIYNVFSGIIRTKGCTDYESLKLFLYDFISSGRTDYSILSNSKTKDLLYTEEHMESLLDATNIPQFPSHILKETSSKLTDAIFTYFAYKLFIHDDNQLSSVSDISSGFRGITCQVSIKTPFLEFSELLEQERNKKRKNQKISMKATRKSIHIFKICGKYNSHGNTVAEVDYMHEFMRKIVREYGDQIIESDKLVIVD